MFAKQQLDVAHQTEFDSIHVMLSLHSNGAIQQKCLERCIHTGAWLSAHPGFLERTSLSAQEWQDGLFLCYGLTPAGLAEVLL